MTHITLILAAWSCTADRGAPQSEPVQVPPAGGDTTVYDRTSHAFSFPAQNLEKRELDIHLAGDPLFEASFVSAPAAQNPGLGPLFNNTACSNCHLRNGRGMPIVGTGSGRSQLLVRTSVAKGTPVQPGGPVPAPGLGIQIQDHAIFGREPEATVELVWHEQSGTFPDGEAYTLRSPEAIITLPDGSLVGDDVMVSLRQPLAQIGRGLVEAIPEEDMLDHADPDDLDGDGISGRVNRVWDLVAGEFVVGRLGWKANVPNVLQQAAQAAFEDMGLSNPLFPEADGTFELDLETIELIADYPRTLAVPARAQPDLEAQAGEARFAALGCVRCHVPSFTTGTHSVFDALSDQEIYAYSDFLLHDMGEGLADGRPDFQAGGSEWRTPPLWGLGLTQTVSPYSSYLHDGRARSFTEAILWHGGEAQAARDRFTELDSAARSEVIAFLRTL